MALRAVTVDVRDAPITHAPRRTPGTTRTGLRVEPRPVAVAGMRHERRRWLLIAVAVFATPFVACLGVLEVVR
jgi:hypothetical protein